MTNDNAKLKNAAIILFLGFLALIILYSIFWGPAKKFGDSLMPARVITVNAEGKIVVSPDIAKISFSVVSEGANPEKLADENNRKINKAIDSIKSLGIDPKDIKTTQYNLSPRYVYDEKSRQSYISGYTIAQTVLVKARELAKTGKILGGLPSAGINQIGSVSFEIDEPEKYLAEARDKAFALVKEKAGKMAASTGTRLGNVINFSEYQQGPVPYYASSIAKGGAVNAVSPTIEPGSQEVSVNVSVTYEIK